LSIRVQEDRPTINLPPVTPRLLNQRGYRAGGLCIGGELRCDCVVRPELRINWEPQTGREVPNAATTCVRV
jgi:hypothetical protein